VETCKQALAKLDVALKLLNTEPKNSPKHSALLDSCIKRFEVLFEYVWKLIKIAAEHQGSEAPGPRPAIQEGIRYGWIQDAEFWTEALDARNGSVHDYFGISTEAYLAIIQNFSKKVPTLFKTILSLSKT
jgi:nucleotidyltransferase substrate binding protein (TIGR01987 family)